MEEFLSFIADILEVDKNTLTLETSQDDVETWDSLMQLRLLGEIEAKYGVMIPMERISTIKKLNDFYQYIKESENAAINFVQRESGHAVRTFKKRERSISDRRVWRVDHVCT